MSQTILYEQVNAENQFLAITNATVSHELRNPLQSIQSQNLKINLCLKELLNIIDTSEHKTVREVSKPVRNILTMVTSSNVIQDSSANIMAFLVDDLLDFAQLNAGKFRKTVKPFDIIEAMSEVVTIQSEKAKLSGIQLSAAYRPQAGANGEVISLFNKKSFKKKPEEGDESGEETEAAKAAYDIGLLRKGDETQRFMVSTDKRRLQQVLLNI